MAVPSRSVARIGHIDRRAQSHARFFGVSDRRSQGLVDSVSVARENTAEYGGGVGTAMTCAQVFSHGVGSPADALPRLSDEH